MALGRSKGAMGGAREDPGRTGRCPGGPRAGRPAPGKTKGALADVRKNNNSSSSSNRSNLIVVVSNKTV